MGGEGGQVLEKQCHLDFLTRQEKFSPLTTNWSTLARWRPPELGKPKLWKCNSVTTKEQSSINKRGRGREATLMPNLTGSAARQAADVFLETAFSAPF